MLGLVVLSGVVYAGYNVTSSKSNSQDSKSTDAITDSIEDQTPETEETLETDEEKAKESTEKPEEKSTNTTDNTDPPEKRVISFTKGGGGVEGDYVKVSANLSETQTGTCTYKFSLNGTVRVTETTTITDSNKCLANIAKSKFPKSAIYSFSLTFLSKDGYVSATQAAYDIEVI